jgi:integral membrane protein (TIGR00529 family)
VTDLIKICIVFIIILLLLRKKLNIEYVMLIASFALFLLYLMPIASVLKACKDAVLNSATIKLILALSFIRIFEMILREHAVLSNMMKSVKAIFKNRKIVAASMPLLIGLLPSVGGAYFSAPMVDEATQGTKMSLEEKGFVNYWLRHPWEYILPLYPGILLASAISKIELHDLITVNLSYAVVTLITGFIFGMKGVKGVIQMDDSLSKEGIWSFIPIAAVLLLAVIFHVELHYALIATVVALYFIYRYKPKAILSSLKHGFSLDVILLIVSIMLFKEATEASGAVRNVSHFFMQEGIPTFPILFLLPFVTGLLTGITIGFVGSTFPLILSITGNVSLAAISFAFASGFLGVLLSPVHVCLILTREYFKADLWGMYKMMIPAGIIVFCAAIVEYMILK